MENKATTKTPIPTYRESLSCLLPPVSCLLSPVFHLLCVLSAFVAVSQLCKTNPISATTKPMQPPVPQTIMKINRPRSTRQKQTQSNPISQYPARWTLYAPRYTKQTQFPRPPPAPGKNPESRSETHIPISRASIKDRKSSIEYQTSSPFCRAFMASLRKTKPKSKWAI